MNNGIIKTRCLAAALLALAGCSKATSADLSREALTVREVEYNLGSVDLGRAAAVADLGTSTVVFSDKGASVLVAGAVSGADGTVTDWASAGVIPAADGEGQWIIGVSGDGEVYTLDAAMELESVSDRYALLGEPVRAVAPLGGASVAFLLEGEIAVADGEEVTRYDLSLTSFAAAEGRVAGVDGKSLHVFDVATGKDEIRPIPAAFVAFDNDGRVVAATKDTLYAEDESGDLIKLGVITEGISALASSPSGVWIAAGSELALLSPDHASISVSKGAALPAGASLVGSSSGDVWVMSATGALSRRSAAPEGDESAWQADVLPIFTRACADCHLPGGSARVDLSYYGAWVARRAEIERRVVDREQPVMPPTGAPQLTDQEIAAVKAWVEGK